MHMRSIRSIGLTLALVVAGLADRTSVGQQKKSGGDKYALLVGVRKYDPNELRGLPYSEPDVVELSGVLEAEGYKPGNVVLMTQTAGADDTRFLPLAANVREELSLLLDEMDEDDSVLIALAGHGVQFQGENESYFCPADARLADKSTLILSGEFRDVTDKDSKTTAIQIKAKIEDRRGELVVELDSRGLFSLTTIAALVGLTTVTPQAASREQAEKRLDQALDKVQSPCLAGTRITPVQDGATLPYSIEILVGPDPGQAKPDLKNYAPRAATLDQDGLAFLKINRGEVYAVKVKNDSKFDAAVTLTIDGLSMYSFSDNKNYVVVFVHAGKSGIIPGWHRTNDVSDSFQVAEYAKSAVAKLLPSSSTFGTITASFKSAWPKDAQPPADEPDPIRNTRSAGATARGNPIDAKYVEETRMIGQLRGAVSVRYNKTADPADLPKQYP